MAWSYESAEGSQKTKEKKNFESAFVVSWPGYFDFLSISILSWPWFTVRKIPEVNILKWIDFS
jgi:hypothetical protein